ncbi:hypothetical protein CCHR01_17892 [Colletotrichum chrysophilum]|uniref:Uncharacterized protein n=1 Tax=Colletotrichum chrysophilum TaxID=1836956 RepID=A0AAD9A1P5_9PEZI|nr:hypothetical protein CCHR01_17892 [Colletotrichum chrysophilum]
MPLCSLLDRSSVPNLPFAQPEYPRSSALLELELDLPLDMT